MNKILFFLLASTQLYSQQTLVPNICEAMFLPQYQNFFFQNNFGVYKVSNLNRIKRLSGIDDIRQRVKELDRFHNNLSVYYNKEIEPIRKKIDLARLNKESKEVIESLEKEIKKIGFSYIDESNAMVDVMFKSLRAEGIPVRLRTRAIEGANSKVYSLEFFSKPLNTPNDAVDLQKKLKQKYGFNLITIDVFDNLLKHSNGFFSSQLSRVEIGLKSLRDMLLRKTPGRTTKHELTHAAFDYKRSVNKDSIYHATYTSYKNKNISEGAMYYKRFMSAEELYTFTNQPFWGAELFRKELNASVYDYMRDFELVMEKLSMNKNIIKQTSDISAYTVKHLEGLILNKKKLVKAMDFYDSNLYKAFSSEDSRSIFFKMKGREVTYSDFIGGDEYQEALKIIYKTEVEKFLKISKKHDDLKGKELRKKVELALSQDGDYIDAAESIINKLIIKQKKLNKVATEIDQLNDFVVEQVDYLSGYIRARNGVDPKFPISEEIKSKLEELRGLYRKLAMASREDYKGFLGNL